MSDIKWLQVLIAFAIGVALSATAKSFLAKAKGTTGL